MFRTIVAKDAFDASSVNEGVFFPLDTLSGNIKGIKANEANNTVTLYLTKPGADGSDTIVLATEEGKADAAAQAVIGGINGKIKNAAIYKVVGEKGFEYGVAGINVEGLTIAAADLAINRDVPVDDLSWDISAGIPGATVYGTLIDSALESHTTPEITLDANGEGTIVLNSTGIAAGLGALQTYHTVGLDTQTTGAAPTLVEVAEPGINGVLLALGSDITFDLDSVTAGDTYSATITDGTNTSTAVTGTFSADPETVTIPTAEQGSVTAGDGRVFSITITRSDADGLGNDAVRTATATVTLT